MSMTSKAGALHKGPGLLPEELEEFEQILRKRKALLADDVLGLGRANLETSAHPGQVADLGTDNAERDLRLVRMESAGGEIFEIDEALERLHDGIFGICEECGAALPIERLRAIPYARLCLSCKQAEEVA
ncbi:MAG: TraR/DksA family transcriptional regulator [Planctomycetes bacterium]|nr:TraR/DksA family transcriptional regulator [Planctomycetota bacterium]